MLKFAAEKAAGGRIWRKLGDAMQVSCSQRWKVLAICCLKGWVNRPFVWGHGIAVSCFATEGQIPLKKGEFRGF